MHTSAHAHVPHFELNGSPIEHKGEVHISHVSRKLHSEEPSLKDWLSSRFLPFRTSKIVMLPRCRAGDFKQAASSPSILSASDWRDRQELVRITPKVQQLEFSLLEFFKNSTPWLLKKTTCTTRALRLTILARRAKAWRR